MMMCLWGELSNMACAEGLDEDVQLSSYKPVQVDKMGMSNRSMQWVVDV